MPAKHIPKGCPSCGASKGSVQVFSDDSMSCHDCLKIWSSGAAFDADHIAKKLVSASTSNDWIENELKDQLTELVKKSKLDVYEEIKGIAERTMEEDHHADTGRMLLGILRWSEEQIRKHQPKREEEF